jgi:hypothetical protein
MYIIISASAFGYCHSAASSAMQQHRDPTLKDYLEMRGIGERTNSIGGVKCSRSCSCFAILHHRLVHLPEIFTSKIRLCTSVSAIGANEVN